MNLLFLAAFGVVIGSALFFIEPKRNKKQLFLNILLGVIGSIVGGMYAIVFFGMDFSRMGFNAYLLIIFTVVLFWFLGKIIRQVK